MSASLPLMPMLTPMPAPTLTCLIPALKHEAQRIAATYQLTLAGPACLKQPGFHLCLGADGLVLQQGEQGKAQVKADFVSGALAHRRRFGGGLGQDIAKAVGVSGAYKPTVVDATAGLGRDSFVLATLGCQVSAVERNPVVAALLEDGLARGAMHADVAEIVARIQLTHQSSHQYLAQCADLPVKSDVIYLDPMFGEDAKGSAQVKKDMQAFRSLVGQDQDADDLLSLALAAARCRVVVKRGRKAAPLAGKAPGYALTGKSNRFDIYPLAKVQAPDSD